MGGGMGNRLPRRPVAAGVCALLVACSAHASTATAIPVATVPAPAPATTASSIATTTSIVTTTTVSPTTVSPIPRPTSVLVVGDSGLYDATPALAAGFRAQQIEFASNAYPFEGLTQPDFIDDMWSDAIATQHPDLVIIGVGAWDEAFVDANGWEAYATEIERAIALLTNDGAHLLWLSVLPGEAPLGDHSVRSRTQDTLYAAAARQHPDVVEYLDVASEFTDTDGSSPRMIDGHLLRKPDGWHLCPDGAAALTHAVLTHLELDSDGWDQGPWRQDARYDTPPNGCNQ